LKTPTVYEVYLMTVVSVMISTAAAGYVYIDTLHDAIHNIAVMDLIERAYDATGWLP